jgi:hypothetical protein
MAKFFVSMAALANYFAAPTIGVCSAGTAALKLVWAEL